MKTLAQVFVSLTVLLGLMAPALASAQVTGATYWCGSYYSTYPCSYNNGYNYYQWQSPYYYNYGYTYPSNYNYNYGYNNYYYPYNYNYGYNYNYNNGYNYGYNNYYYQYPHYYGYYNYPACTNAYWCH